jgi:hypothetical protein
MGRLQTLAKSALGVVSRMRSVVATALCRRAFREGRPERLDTARRLQWNDYDHEQEHEQD